MTTTTPMPKQVDDFDQRIAEAVNHWMAMPETPEELRNLSDTVMASDTPLGVPWPAKRVIEPDPALTLLTEVVAALPMAIVVLDFQGCVKLWTDAAVVLFGWSSTEVMGAPPPFVSPVHAAEHQSILKLLRSGNVAGERIVSRHGKDGKARTLALFTSQTVGGDFVLTFREVIPGRTAPVADTSASDAPQSKLEALGKMIGAVSHDFNNVLGAICGSAEMMSDRFAYGTAERELLDVIRTAGLHATGLTRRLMQCARPGPVTAGVVDLAGVMTELLPLIRSLMPADVTVSYPPAPDLPGTRAEVTVLEQVILNLATNAGQAMPKGGQLRFRTEPITLELPKLNLVPGLYLVLTVSDTGTGIDDDTRARLFEPFFTTKARGTGLGLATVNDLVRQAGGSIELESEPGRGSTFRVYLPAVADAAPRLDGHGLSALIAEDDPTIRELMKRALESVGFDVSIAAHGEEALQMARWMSNDIDLLVTDVVMPGLGGRRLAEKLRADWPDLAVVFASGYPPLEENLPRSTAFLTKPFTTKHLLATVAGVLKRVHV